MNRSYLLVTSALALLACEPSAPPTDADATTSPPPVASTASPPGSGASDTDLPATAPRPKEAADSPATSASKGPSIAERMAAIREQQSLLARARAALSAGNSSEAEGHLDALLSDAPAHLAAIALKAKICREDERFDEALVAIELALDSSPQSDALVYELGRTLHAAGKHRECADRLAAHIDADRAFPQGRRLLAEAFAALEDREGVLGTLEAAADAGVDNAALFAASKALEPYASDARFRAALAEIKRTLHARGVQDAGRGGPLPILSDRPDRVSLAQELRRLRSYLIGSGSWEFSLRVLDLDNRPLRIANFAGKKLVVLFWGSWSVTGAKVLDGLAAARKEFAEEKNLEFLVLAWENHIEDGRAQYVKDALAKSGHSGFRVGLLEPTHFKDVYLEGIPGIYFVNEEGRVRFYGFGYYDTVALTHLIRQFLAGGGTVVEVPEGYEDVDAPVYEVSGVEMFNPLSRGGGNLKPGNGSADSGSPTVSPESPEASSSPAE